MQVGSGAVDADECGSVVTGPHFLAGVVGAGAHVVSQVVVVGTRVGEEWSGMAGGATRLFREKQVTSAHGTGAQAGRSMGTHREFVRVGIGGHGIQVRRQPTVGRSELRLDLAGNQAATLHQLTA